MGGDMGGDGCGREYSSGSSKLRLWTNSVAAGNLVLEGPDECKSLPSLIPSPIWSTMYSRY
jgi:hypothetical protein